MRTPILATAIAALLSFTVIPGRKSLVNAQSLTALPTCAQPAILAAIQASGCQIMDKKCFCTNPALIPSLTSAVDNAWSDADQAALAAFASTYCGAAAGAASPASPSSGATTPINDSASFATTLPPPTGSASLSTSTITTAPNNMTMNDTMTMTSSGMMSPTMSISHSSIEWQTNVTTGGAVAETGLSMVALAVAAGAMGAVLGEL